VEGRQDNPLPTQVFDERASQDNGLVGLPGQFGQFMGRLPTMTRAKGLKTKRLLQFDQVFAPRLPAAAIFVPFLRGCFELRGHQPQQGRIRRRVDAERHSGKTQVAEQDREAQAIGRAAPLPDDRQVGLAQAVMPDEFLFTLGQRQQAFALGGGKDRAARHEL
jgi:hypothetical protein